VETITTELLLEELRDLKQDIRELRAEIKDQRKDIWTLKSRFMIIAISMGLAGGKISTILPFLK